MNLDPVSFFIKTCLIIISNSLPTQKDVDVCLFKIADFHLVVCIFICAVIYVVISAAIYVVIIVVICPCSTD